MSDAFRSARQLLRCGGTTTARIVLSQNVFDALLQRHRSPFLPRALEGDVIRQPGGTLKFLAIRLKPKITLNSSDEAHVKATEDFAHKAEQYCVISNAIRGNVELSVVPEIITAV